MSAIIAATSDASPPRKSPRRSRLWVSQRQLNALIILWIILRLVFASAVQLVPDEAYYWTWSRHLEISYFDHPPMVAYFIRLGTSLAGDTELGVRCWAAILTASAIVILSMTARRLTGDSRAAIFVALMLLASPFMCVISAIVTPDTPLCFFSSAALACVLFIFAPPKTGANAAQDKSRNPEPLWLLFGALLGCAMLSKYTAVLLGLAVLGAMLSSREGRRALGTVWPWLGAMVALLIFSPVVLWNAGHDWASFRFQLQHGLGGGQAQPVKNLLTYLGGQFLIATPVLFIFCLAVLAIYWRRRNNPMHIRILLFSATLPLLFFAWSSLHKHVEANWPIFAYVPGTLLVGQFLSESWTARRTFWAEVAIKVALVGAILIHLPQLFWEINPKFSVHQWDDLFGWRQLARQVHDVAGASPVFATDYEYAAEMQFYLPGQPDAWPLPDASRPTAFDFFPGRPDLQSFDRVVLIRRGEASDPDWRLKQYFGNFQIIHFQLMQKQRTIRSSSIIVATH